MDDKDFIKIVKSNIKSIDNTIKVTKEINNSLKRASSNVSDVKEYLAMNALKANVNFVDNFDLIGKIDEDNAFRVHCVHYSKKENKDVCCWCTHENSDYTKRTLCKYGSKEEREKNKHGTHVPLKIFDSKDLLELFE